MAYEDGVFATFYDDAIKNEFTMKKNGDGIPVFDDVIMIRVQIPNSTDCVPRPATDADKKRFPKSWQAYVTGKEPADSGFPLKEWPQMTASELKVCEALQIKTVEQLANVPDSGLHRLGAGSTGLKNRAQKHLQEISSNDTLKKENESLQKQIADLTKRLDDMQKPPKRKPKHVSM